MTYPACWLMPSGIAARLRKNDAFVQQIRKSSDINYYNVDSMWYSSGPWQSVHFETGSWDSMDHPPKDSTNFRIFYFKKQMPSDQSCEQLNYILMSSCLHVNRDKTWENREIELRGKMYSRCECRNPNQLDLWPSWIIKFLPRMSTWQLWLVTRERYTCPISYSVARARVRPTFSSSRQVTGWLPASESREGAAGCSLARFSAIDSAHASTRGRPNERASERSNGKHLAGWRRTF